LPRDGEKVRRRLQAAALELYRDRGYDETTTAEIAAAAGVTERTFFRHFADKREVLFGGEAALSAILTSAVREAPATLNPWGTLLRAFQAAGPLLSANRSFSEPRQRVIASSPPLRERELTKSLSLTASLASALGERGVPDRQAMLASQMGVAAFGQAFTVWLEEDSSSLDDLLVQAFRAVHDLSAGG
jgi:AcrR family transcriptional regulator